MPWVCICDKTPIPRIRDNKPEELKHLAGVVVVLEAGEDAVGDIVRLQ